MLHKLVMLETSPKRFRNAGILIKRCGIWGMIDYFKNNSMFSKNVCFVLFNPLLLCIKKWIHALECGNLLPTVFVVICSNFV